ncbi:hypothetical protein DIPPA_29051 [Diplonema papillatum]|nr:hypothetical protein DIPPA_29051 [Diplonema papillatum]
MLSVEVGFMDHLKKLELLELGGDLVKPDQKLVQRADERAILDSSLNETLEKYPAFAQNYYACAERRQKQLRLWWSQKDSRLEPLVKACADLGNFDCPI